MDHSIAITGMGMVTAQGVGVVPTWQGVIHHHDALRPWSGAPDNHPLAKIKVAQCPELPRAADLPPRLWNQLARTQQLAALAADEALAQAAIPPASLNTPTGLFLATTTCGMDVSERFYAQYRDHKTTADPNLMRRMHPAEIAALLTRRHHLGAPNLRHVCLSTCVGSAMAIASAMDAINLGQCDIALAGGSEALCRVVLSGFHSLKVVAPEGCRPFDKNRPGITVGEAAAVLILENLDHARRRGAPILAYLRGAGITCDAHHLTAPDPAATHAAAAIREALDRAGIPANGIQYLNAHGTGTPGNDSMEAAAIQQIFGQNLPAVSSTKRATGHTFGAAGAVEATFCIQAIREGIIPPNAGALEPDPDLWQSPDPVVRQARPQKIAAALSTNFAFGGNNTALIFSSEPAHES